jgi:hypothetical protein
VIKHYVVNKVDRYTIELRPQSDGTVKPFALEHPPDPYGGNAHTHHLYSSGEICVAAGHEPRSFDKAAAIAMVWCEGWSTYVRTGHFPSGSKRVNV